jgi:hypothetical protein
LKISDWEDKDVNQAYQKLLQDRQKIWYFILDLMTGLGNVSSIF